MTDTTGASYWQGIDFHYGVTDSTILDSNIIEYASEGVSIYHDTHRPYIYNNTIRYCKDYGIYGQNNAWVYAVGNTLLENGTAISVTALQIDSTLYGNTYTNNTKNYIEVRAGGDYRLKVDNKVYDWLKDGAPYVLSDHLYVFKDGQGTDNPPILNIQSGVTLKFPKDKFLQIGDGNSGGAVNAK